jgi:hypothetical protein
MKESILKKVVRENFLSFPQWSGHRLCNLIYSGYRGDPSIIISPMGKEPIVVVKIGTGYNVRKLLTEYTALQLFDCEGTEGIASYVPKAYGIHEIGSTTFFIRQYIPGNMFHARGIFRHAGSKKTAMYLSRVMEFLLVLWKHCARLRRAQHNVERLERPLGSKPGYSSHPGLKDFKLDEVQLTGVKHLKEFAPRHDALARLEGPLREGWKDKTVLNHMDFNITNFLEFENGFKVMDWASSRLGPPIYDWFYFLVFYFEYIFGPSKAYSYTKDRFNLLEKIFFTKHKCSDLIRNTTRELYERAGIERSLIEPFFFEACLHFAYERIYQLDPASCREPYVSLFNKPNLFQGI